MGFTRVVRSAQVEAKKRVIHAWQGDCTQCGMTGEITEILRAHAIQYVGVAVPQPRKLRNEVRHDGPDNPVDICPSAVIASVCDDFDTGSLAESAHPEAAGPDDRHLHLAHVFDAN